MLSVLNSWDGRASARIGGEATSLVMLGAKIPIQVPDRRLEVVECRNPPGPGSRGQEVLTSDVTFLHAPVLLDLTDPLL